MGCIDFQWGQWKDFLPQLNINYNVRYQQHFSVLDDYPHHIPKNREFYEQPWVIDAGSSMYQRLLNGEKNVTSLLEYGWRKEECRLLPPPTFQDYIECFYYGLRLHYHDIPLDDLPVVSIPFVRKDKTGNCLEDSKFVRIGMEDEVPDPREWNLMVIDDNGSIDVPLDLFSNIFCGNRPPMNSIMFDHDGSHVIDYLNNPGYYLANQDMFARICGRHPTKTALVISEDPKAGNPYTTYGRMCGLHEELCLPNTDKHELMGLLNKLSSIGDLQTRGKSLAKYLPKYVVRHGGGMSDPYNLHNDLNIRTTPKERVHRQLSNSKARSFNNTGRELFSQLAIESMMGIGSDIEYLSSIALEKPAKYLLEKKIWQLETALRMGIELDITVDKFSYETTEQVVDQNCDSALWLASWVDPYSLTAEFYLSPSATRV